MELTSLTLEEASRRVRDKSISPVELTHACLSRIEKLNPKLNAFITVTAGEAMTQARQLETEQRRGQLRGPLHGIPIALKDLIDVAGVKTTAASAVLADNVAAEDAAVVRRLRGAGAVLLGKLNMDEFAYNFTSETSHFGPIHNPWALDRTPGGSSGGSAAAVAARLCFGALGSDTGGSIRQPAGFCNIVGLKASYGLVSTRGALPLAWSLDHLGPMCRTVEDTGILLRAMADLPPAPDVEIRSLRIGIPRTFFFDDLDGETEAIVNRTIDLIRKMTAGARDVELPEIGDLPVLRAEAYTYHEPFLKKYSKLYHEMTRNSILSGADVSMPDYVRARLRLEELRRQADRLFGEVDLLLTPTSARPPILLEEGRVPDLILLRNAIPMNIYDLPTISVPCGFTREGLPVGMQISGPRLGEHKVLALAQAYQQATDWHRHEPEL